MSPQDLLDRYAHAVASRLPARQRADVTAELRALLTEELNAQPNPDLEAAKALLLRFGAPDEVAARYAPPALVVEARDTHLYWRVIFTISAVLIALAAASAAAPSETDSLEASRALSGELALRLLETVGLATLIFWMMGASRRAAGRVRWRPERLPPVRDPDHIARLPMSFAAAYFVLGTAVLIAPQHALGLCFGGELPVAARPSFTYDADFRATTGPLLLVSLIASIAVLVWAIAEGRWRRLTRLLSFAIGVATALLMLWAIRAGPIFVGRESDQLTKAIVAIIAVVSIVELFVQGRRLFAGGPPPGARPALHS